MPAVPGNARSLLDTPHPQPRANLTLRPPWLFLRIAFCKCPQLNGGVLPWSGNAAAPSDPSVKVLRSDSHAVEHGWGKTTK